MSKGSLFWGNAVGKLGESVFYRVNGQQRNRAYLKVVKNPKTRAQMTNRVKWANVINMWRLLKPFIAMGMQNRPTRQSDYNAFVSVNVRASEAYLLKAEAKQNATLLAPYFVTSGTLGNRSMSTAAVTNILVGDLDMDSITIGDLSSAIISQNIGFAIGDQITVIAVGQTLGEGGIPMVVPAAFKFILAPADATDYAIDVIEVTGNIAPTVSDGYLAWEFAGADYADFGGAIVQSRIDGNGQLLVSTSRLSIEFQTPSLGQSYNPYGVSLDEAMSSYGFNPAVYLSPQSTGSGSSVAAPRVTSATLGTNNLVDGGSLTVAIGDDMELQINGLNFVVGAVSVQYGSDVVSLTVENDKLITGTIVTKSGSTPLVITWAGGSITTTLNAQPI